MKKFIYLFTSLLTIISLISCSEETASENQTPSTGTITANINGQNWSSTIAAASLQSINMVGVNGSSLQILGTANNNSNLAINIPMQNLSTGTFTYSGIDADGSLDYTVSSNNFASDDTGGTFTFTISNYDITNGTISGTFSGTLIDFDNGSNQISVTNGVFSNIKVYSQQIYSNGSMSLKLNNGSVFSMDSNNSDNKFLSIQQVNEANKVILYGYNTNSGSDKGVYSILLPKNVTAGTYSLDNTTYGAGYTNGNNVQYTTTGGSITVTSHNGYNLVGTFNFTATGNSQTVTISQGSFNITHN